ncbi:hypothetical protein ACQ86N_13645 [Puia sp. P3]|uniref:hypothetical protein n=1 Tax=Puia sp. P3 TaxID=3423952 RepID=UPI003D67C4F5
MFRKNHLVKINLPGGIIAAGDLYTIVEAADRARVTECCFGTRQQLYCKVSDAYSETFLRQLEQAGIFYESGSDGHPNIISSYVTEAVFSRSALGQRGAVQGYPRRFRFPSPAKGQSGGEQPESDPVLYRTPQLHQFGDQ